MDLIIDDQMIKNSFTNLDLDGDGRLDFHEFETANLNYMLFLTPQKIDTLFDYINQDKQSNDDLSMEDF